MLPYLTVECQPQEVIQVSTMNWCRQPKEMLPLSLKVHHQHQQMIQVQLRIKVVNLKKTVPLCLNVDHQPQQLIQAGIPKKWFQFQLGVSTPRNKSSFSCGLRSSTPKGGSAFKCGSSTSRTESSFNCGWRLATLGSEDCGLRSPTCCWKIFC